MKVEIKLMSRKPSSKIRKTSKLHRFIYKEYDQVPILHKDVVTLAINNKKDFDIEIESVTNGSYLLTGSSQPSMSQL